MTGILGSFRRNRTRAILFAALLVFFLLAIGGMGTEDWIITLLRALSVAAVTFLVASGFSLIFGLMDVLNLAHGTLFMIGAYMGWTVYVRPDTFLGLAAPLALLAAGLVLLPLVDRLLARISLPEKPARILPWALLALGLLLVWFAFPRFPITGWDTQVYENSPIIFGSQLDEGILDLPAPVTVDPSTFALGVIAILLGGALLAAGLAAFARRNRAGSVAGRGIPGRAVAASVVLIVLGVALSAFAQPLTQALVASGTTVRFFIAIVIATLAGAGLGALMEVSLIRPLYSRPIYQLMLTLGLGVVGREVVIAVWGRTQLTMAKPALFDTSGPGCPAQSIGDWLAHQCSTITFMGSRIRTYNEIFVILVGLIVLVAVWLLLQRSRIGMVIRAGVQDREMVEALGINVRRVFTFVFALGVALAALGGVLSGPATGVSDGMGESLLLSGLIALAIGGLTSFPGAAAGSLLVGLVQQFMVQYGQIGISLPFLSEP
ncbi:MAG: branched-chain amino acid ABC transporter permease, partial [Rudaea sp.]